MSSSSVPFALAAFAVALTGCSPKTEPSPPVDKPAPAAAGGEAAAAGGEAAAAGGEAIDRAAFAAFTPLAAPAAATDEATQARIKLGQTLYWDTRLSKNHDVSCNSCHDLSTFGVDNKKTSSGHKGQLGGRNSPTTFNAALHFAQFWDGRAQDVEEQALGPVLNPVEMAMPDEASVLRVLTSIPGYAPLFKKAFPEDKDPITFVNMGRAIGAFERQLITPSAWDRFLAGDDAAVSADVRAGAKAYLAAGCTACHMGATYGGSMYQKLGLVKPWPQLADNGRSDITKNDAEKFFFKVPSLRNVTKTGPYLHDGSETDLTTVVKKMGEHQLGRTLSDDDAQQIVTFLGALEAAPDPTLLAEPTLPPSGPKTPAPDPS